MRIHPATLILALMTVSGQAQQRLYGPKAPVVTSAKGELSFGFNHIQANAPPGVSNDFGINGGFAGGAYNFTRHLGLAAEFTGGHGNHISNLGQDLTLTTYLVGPRYTFTNKRFSPFGQILFGGAHGSDSYFPTGTTFTTSETKFAYSAGGGLDLNLNRRFAIRLLEAQFLHTGFDNGSSNTQRQLMLGAGVVFKFGSKVIAPPPAPVPEVAIVTRPRGDIHFSCSLNVVKVEAGQRLHILGNTMTEPDHLEVMYTWMPQAGMIEGSGREVNLNTTGLGAGHYTIRGHAAVVGDYAMAADCQLPFEITAPVAAPAVAAPVAAASSEAIDAPRQKEFHTNVPDAYFDYNSAAMRMDARAATTHAADFLNQHPDMRVRVEGFADERGSVEYNLMLGQQRAEAARNALIGAGVDPARVEIISFGKAQPVCAEANESCYRQNRRAAFSLHP